jgi:hypothetical protein
MEIRKARLQETSMNKKTPAITHAVYEVEDDLGGHVGYWRDEANAKQACPKGGRVRRYEHGENLAWGACQDDVPQN